MLHLLQILLLAVVQGLAELLPVSSSAHVTIVARLLDFAPASDFEWAFLLVMLHTGTMFSVLIYFWPRWKAQLRNLPVLLVATACTGVLALGLKKAIERFFLHGEKIESLFQNLLLIAGSLTVVGLIIIAAGIKERRAPGRVQGLSWPHGLIIGIVQGVCLPFRGFSRSGATISTGLFLGIERMRAEEFSFALAVLLTPAVIAWEGREVLNQYKAAEVDSSTAASGSEHPAAAPAGPAADAGPAQRRPPANSLGSILAESLLGMGFSFVAGLVALRWLSRWLEQGHWTWFGYYCLAAAVIAIVVHFRFPPVHAS